MDYATGLAHGLHTRLQLAQPVDLEGLCQTLGVELRHWETPIEAMYIAWDSYAYIVVSKSIPYGCAKFRCRIAHELGHHMTMPPGEQQIALYGRNLLMANKLEKWAVNFSYELLMPAKTCRRLVNSGMQTWELAEYFGVTDLYSEHRLQWLYGFSR